MSKVKDIKLAKKGKLDIEWAESNMPVLLEIRNRFEKEKPLRGLKVGACLHVTKETAVLAKTLRAGGAKVFVCGSNPLSTKDEVAAGLVKEGIEVFAWRGLNEKEYYWCLNEVLKKEPNITMDDGGDLIITIHSKKKELIKNVIGGTEETTTGVIRFKAMEKDGVLKYPVVAVNDAYSKFLFDNRYGTGQSTIDGILRATAILLAGKNFVVGGYGWCLAKGTKIYTDKGIKNIEDVQKNDKVRGFNGYGKVLNKFNNGIKSVYRVKTDDGYNIKATKDHKVLIFTNDGFKYKKVENLLPGDNAVISGNNSILGKNNYKKILEKYGFDFDPEVLFYILGCLIGDGTVTKRRSVSLAYGIKDKIHFKDIFGKLGFHVGECVSNSYLDINSTKFRKLLFELGLDYLLSFQKTIPEAVFYAEEKLVSNFLKGLFDTDGWVRKETRGRMPVIGLSSTSKTLLEQTQVLLLNFGINSHIATREGRGVEIRGHRYKTRRSYELVIKGLKSREIFTNKIGFALKRKHAEIINLKNIKEIDKYDGIPYFKEIIKKINKKYKIVVSREDAKVININGVKKISKEVAKRILDYKYSNLDDKLLNELKIIINNDYKLIPLKVVKRIREKEEVYDIEVSNVNSFVANGIMVHNCGKGIAQRAKGMGANVIITEVNSQRALEAVMDGFFVLTMAEAARIGDVFVTATGDKGIITKEHFLKMKSGAILANAGHFNVELNLKDLAKLSKGKRRLRDNLEEYRMKNGKKIYILAEGRLVNLAAAEGHPSEVMDMSFSLQALSAEWLTKNRNLEPKVYKIPEEIDNKISELKLKTMGIRIDKLSQEQKKYLESWQEGT